MTAVSPVSDGAQLFQGENSVVMSETESAKNFDVIDKVETVKYKQVIKMIMVLMLPIIALIAKASILFEASLSTQRTASTLQITINRTLVTAKGIHLLQVERGLTAVFLGTEVPDIKNFQRLANARLQTNEFLVGHQTKSGIQPKNAASILHTGKDIVSYLDGIRHQVDKHKNASLVHVIDLYTEITLALNQDTVDVAEVPSRKDIWPLIVSFSAVSRAIDLLGIQRAFGGAAFSSCYLSPENRDRFTIMDSQIRTFLEIAIRYYQDLAVVYQERYEGLGEVPGIIESEKKIILDPESLANVCGSSKRSSSDLQSVSWFETMTRYMEFYGSLERYVTLELSSRVPGVEQEAARGMASYFTVMIGVTCTSFGLCFWYGFKLNDMMTKMKMFGNQVREKSEEVREEKKKTDVLLYQMMPQNVADKMKFGLEVLPENFDSVTIYFSDIVGWSDIGTKLSPHELVILLNKLYSSFDGVIDKYDVYKVETIADSYMCVSGLPERNGTLHVMEIGQMALEMMEFARSFIIQNLPGVPLNLRIGFHSGSCVAGVVGTKMPRYCLFGDTVNTASRMETNGEAMRIHVSSASRRLMVKVGGFELQGRGKITIKGKGEMETFWLVGYRRPNVTTPIKISKSKREK